MNRSGGLTHEEVHKRQQSGRINRTRAPLSKSAAGIVRDNLLTPFNAVNALLAAALILVGSYHNLLFIGVAAVNSLIGIVQELRSKRALKRLCVLCAAKARVRRDGQVTEIPTRDIVQDDCLLLQSGDRICVDAVLQSGHMEVDESLLTGESDAVLKKPGDPLLSGSFVISGHGEAIAVHVGDDAYAAKLTAFAGKYQHLRSEMMLSIDSIIRFTGLFMIPFAVLLYLHERHAGSLLKDAVTSVAASLIGMMPQGLILLTTVALMVGALRLARRQTLVQELSGIEALSRVSLLCLDKTGTLTKGTLTVREVIGLSEDADTLPIGAAIHAIGDSNPTALALCRYYPDEPLEPCECIPFSAERQWSAAMLCGRGTVFFGAWESLFPRTPLPASVREKAKSGNRLLSVAFSKDDTWQTAIGTLMPIAVIVLLDELRDGAAEVVSCLQKEGVTLRVLSGDHPDTVAAVAVKAGLLHAEKAVDASSLTTKDALRKAAEEYTVFGRVSPAQKRELIRCFKEQGHTVAMMGDGVNDVYALKEADCSVAMASGSDAAVQISQLAVADADLNGVCAALTEGRRVVNNITRTASLFLVKTVMSFLVTLCTVVLPMHYPFEPLQLTLVGVFAESLPGFFLTLEPNRERIRERFLSTVLCRAVPNAVTITLCILAVQLGIAPFLSLSTMQASTLCVYLTGFVWLIGLYRLCHPFTRARRVLYSLMTVGFFGSALLFAVILPTAFAACGITGEAVFVLPTVPMLMSFAVSAITAVLTDCLLYRLAQHIFRS